MKRRERICYKSSRARLVAITVYTVLFLSNDIAYSVIADKSHVTQLATNTIVLQKFASSGTYCRAPNHILIHRHYLFQHTNREGIPQPKTPVCAAIASPNTWGPPLLPDQLTLLPLEIWVDCTKNGSCDVIYYIIPHKNSHCCISFPSYKMM